MGELAGTVKVVLDAIAEPFRAFARWSRRRRYAGEVRERRFRVLVGLPPELKAVLVEFHLQGAHTVRMEPFDPEVQQLTRMGLLMRGAGTGGWDAAESWMVMDLSTWDLLEQLERRDPLFRRLMADARQEADDHAQRGGSH